VAAERAIGAFVAKTAAIPAFRGALRFITQAIHVTRRCVARDGAALLVDAVAVVVLALVANVVVACEE
jgi:hypothetical protein